VNIKEANLTGARELRRVLLPKAGLIVSICLFSAFVNLLMLTGPLFMLQVYDRVLGSRSEETLVALLLLVAGLYALMGVLDYSRGRVAARVGASFQSRLDPRIFDATIISSKPTDQSPLRDLEAVQRLLSSPALFSLLDMPWAVVFVAVIFGFHPMLGWLALGGGASLIIIAIINQFASVYSLGQANQKAAVSDVLANTFREQGELVRALGMENSVRARWQRQRSLALRGQIRSSDLTGAFASLTRTLRMFLQSAILALGAYLFLHGELSAGAMIAASILLGRALAPVEQTIAAWPIIVRARSGWRRLTELLERVPNTESRTKLPRPRAILEVHGITVVPPGGMRPTLKLEGFCLAEGQALGVVGQSASGKSTLARVLAGIWRPASGTLRLDGAALGQYGADLGLHIGYVSQEVSLFDGTVSENIARLVERPSAISVVTAAKRAGAHEMILKLPDGYDTMISGKGENLSGGQKQRIGLARAMYGNPVLLILDEPNANLDAPGIAALNRAVSGFKKDGNVAIIMAHRPSGIAECDFLMILQDGRCTAFGPRDEVLRTKVQGYGGTLGRLEAAAKP